MDFMVMGKVTGLQDIQKMFASCPGILRNQLLSWLLFENQKFIGDKKLNGAIREKMERKKTWINGNPWRTQVRNLFKGYVVDPVTNQRVNFRTINASTFGAGTGVVGGGISMSLKMGLMYRTQKQIHAALEALEESHTVSSDKYMPIPIKGSDLSKSYQKFKFWLSSGMFNIVYKNGLALYFLKSRGKSRNALMFVGRKNTRVNFHFSFYQSWESRQLGFESRGNSAIDKAIAKIDKV